LTEYEASTIERPCPPFFGVQRTLRQGREFNPEGICDDDAKAVPTVLDAWMASLRHLSELKAIQTDIEEALRRRGGVDENPGPVSLTRVSPAPVFPGLAVLGTLAKGFAECKAALS
jgi:hypothetical protein